MITKKEFTVLDAIINNEYQDLLTERDAIDAPTWLSVVSDYSYSGNVFSGIISALAEKNMVRTDLDVSTSCDINQSTIAITEIGFEAWEQYKNQCKHLHRAIDSSEGDAESGPITYSHCTDCGKTFCQFGM